MGSAKSMKTQRAETDRRIKARLADLDMRTKAYQAEGLSRAEASQRAFADMQATRPPRHSLK